MICGKKKSNKEGVLNVYDEFICNSCRSMNAEEQLLAINFDQKTGKLDIKEKG